MSKHTEGPWAVDLSTDGKAGWEYEEELRERAGLEGDA